MTEDVTIPPPPSVESQSAPQYFADQLDRLGTDLGRWPKADAGWAAAFRSRRPAEAEQLIAEAFDLDNLLKVDVHDPVGSELEARILASFPARSPSWVPAQATGRAQAGQPDHSHAPGQSSALWQRLQGMLFPVGALVAASATAFLVGWTSLPFRLVAPGSGLATVISDEAEDIELVLAWGLDEPTGWDSLPETVDDEEGTEL